MMVISKKLLYMVLGGFLALSLAFGAYATFAQTDDGSDDAAPAEGDDTTYPPAFSPGPGRGNRGGRQGFGDHRPDPAVQNENLAAALGITVEELEAAHDAVRTAVVEQAVEDGLLTQEQADQILANEFRGGGGLGMRGFAADHDQLLADELGISVEELEAAREEVKAAGLEELVAAGVLTQEQADMMQAQQAVREYLDTDAITESIQGAYEAAIEQALAAGDITQAQADQMLNNLPAFTPGFGGRGGGHGFRGGPRGFQGQPNFNGSQGEGA